MSAAIRHIRPKVLFRLLEEAHPEENVTFNVLVPTSMIGGLTLLESSILVTLMQLLHSTEFFEFGTYHGATSVLLAANSPDAARITTLDLSPAAVPMAASPAGASGDRHLQDGAENDAYLRRSFAARGSLYLDRAGEAVQRKVRRLYGDSREFDPARAGLSRSVDFIFIDGGHDFDTVRIDTANALKMARDDAVILWHDYRSTLHGEVTRFVDGFARETPVVHVENTLLAFTLLGRFHNMLPAD